MGSVRVELHTGPVQPGTVQALVGPTSPLEPGGSQNPLPDVSVWPTLEIRQRTRTGFNDDGAPLFTWATLLSGEATLYESREEWDSKAGVTKVKARATFGNTAGLAEVPETAVVAEPASGVLWRITSTAVTPAAVTVEMERIESTVTVTP